MIIIGDIHGNTKSYQKFLRQNFDQDQETIQIGDMGLGFAGVGLHEMPMNHRWFRGNHDQPEKCYKNKNYMGDYGFLSEHDLFWTAGAFSIDRAYRVEGQSWWADEELSYETLQNAIDCYIDMKPKYMLSHEAPAITAKNLLYDLQGEYFAAKLECSMSRTAEALQVMLAAHQPDEWVFGHYHVDKSFKVEGYKTKFTCVGGVMSSGEKPHTYELKTTGR